MKKTKPKKNVAPKTPELTDDMTAIETPINEENLAEDQFAVTGREEEASSSGHRVEPIINDEEGNAQQLIEEGLHGYLHATPKNSQHKR